MGDYMDNMMGDEHIFWKGSGMTENEWIEGWENYADGIHFNNFRSSTCIVM